MTKNKPFIRKQALVKWRQRIISAAAVCRKTPVFALALPAFFDRLTFPVLVDKRGLFFGTDVHKGFNKHTGTVQSYFKKRTFLFYPPLRYNVLAKEDFTMKEQKRFLELSEFEWRLLIKCLNEARSLFLDNGKPVEDIDELLIKAFKMKFKKVSI